MGDDAADVAMLRFIEAFVGWFWITCFIFANWNFLHRSFAFVEMAMLRFFEGFAGFSFVTIWLK